MSNIETPGLTPEEMGVRPDETDAERPIGESNWQELKSQGWEYHTTMSSRPLRDPGQVGRTVEALKEKYGEENVRTGNAMDPETGEPTGLTGAVGVYLRKTPEQN